PGGMETGFEREFAATLPERVPLDVSDQQMAPQVYRGGARTVADIDRQALFEFAPMRRNAPADHLGETLPVARQQTDGDREAAADRLDQVRDRLEHLGQWRIGGDALEHIALASRDALGAAPGSHIRNARSQQVV